MAPIVNGFPNWIVAFMGAIILSLVTGAIWLGGNSNQISVNSARLNNVEQKIDKLRDDDANSQAQMQGLERRLQRMEGQSPPGR